MSITKQEAIKLHRELWTWLAENPMKQKGDWPGWKDNGGPYREVNKLCFACEATLRPSGCTGACLLKWPAPVTGERYACEHSLYKHWRYATAPEERSRLAALIRDLPESEPIFKVGDKVVPMNKSVGNSLDESVCWCRAKEEKQPYLFITFVKYDTPYHGTVDYGCSDKQNDGGDYFCETDLIPYVEPKPEPKFKVGDKVVPVAISWPGWSFEDFVNNGNNVPQFFKKNGYLYVSTVKNGDYQYLCGTDNMRGRDRFKESELIPYIEPKYAPKFKVGDKVVPISKTVPDYEVKDIAQEQHWSKCKERGYFFINGINKALTDELGQTVYYCAPNLPWTQGNYFFESDLIPYVWQPKFKVGDEVRIVGQSHGWGGVKVGDIGIVARIPLEEGASYEIKVDTSFHCAWTANEECPQPANEETEPPAFKVGDRVRCVKNCGKGIAVGEIGTIKALGKSCGGVEFDNNVNGHNNLSGKLTGREGHCWNIPLEGGYLELVKDKPFEINDRVIVVEKAYKGFQGTIIDLWNSEPNQYATVELDTSFPYLGNGGCVSHPKGRFGKMGHCTNILFKDLANIPANEAPETLDVMEYCIRFHMEGPKTTCYVTLDDKTYIGEAVCKPGRTWDENAGKRTAKSKAFVQYAQHKGGCE